MLTDTISEEQLTLIEVLYHPRGFAETMFSVGDNLALFDPDKFLEIRMGQIPLLGFDHLIDYDPKLNEKENFARRERAGNIAVFAARLFGKTFCVEELDFNQYAVCTENEIAGFTSFDYTHLKGVLDKMYLVWMNHPIISSFCNRVIRGDYQFSTKYGITIEGINMKVSAGSSAGDGFFQKHFKRLYIEENSKESDIVYEKRSDSKSEIGMIERSAGMTDFVKNSPAGKVFYDPKEAYRVINLPQFINPNFGEKENQDRIKKWNGSESSGYKIYVKGEVCEDGENVFDMKDVRDLCYPHKSNGEIDEKRTIKHIEITKKKFIKFKNYLSLIRPNNADTLYVAADIGQKGGITEIILMAGVKEKFKYLYNITLINLTKPQQYDIFKHITQTVNVDYLATDSSILPKEFILVKVNNKIKYIRIEDLYKNHISEKIETPTYNDGQLEWKEAKVIRHHYKGKVSEVITSPGNYSVNVTDNHSMMVWDKNKLKEKKTSDCVIGDWMFSPKNLKCEEPKYQKLQYYTAKKNKYSKVFKKEVILDERLGYLLGWCCAEGSSKTTNYQLSLGNEKPKGQELLKLFRDIFKIERGHITEITKEQQNKKNYIFKGRLVKATASRYNVVFPGGKNMLTFLENLVAKGSHNKKIPEPIFNSPISVREEFIRGLLEGDRHQRKRKINWEYNLKTVSEELAKGYVTLLQLNNQHPSIYLEKNGSYTVSFVKGSCIGHWEGIPYKFISNSKCAKKIYKTKTAAEKYVNKSEFDKLMGYDWNFRKVKQINKQDYIGHVYDLVVEDNHTFVAGCGNILVHNTGGTGEAIYSDMQVDPKFKNVKLIWVAFNSNVSIGIDLDDNGNPVRKGGKIQEKMVNSVTQSVTRLCHLFYNALIFLPYDSRLDEQLDKVVSIVSKATNKVMYRCIAKEDHLWQAFQVFSIAQWLVEYGKLSKSKNSLNDTYDKIGVI